MNPEGKREKKRQDNTNEPKRVKKNKIQRLRFKDYDLKTTI